MIVRLIVIAMLAAPQLVAAQAVTPPESSTAASDAPLGRLFFSPERRSALERQRQLNIREAQTLEGETLHFNGVVVRSSGKKTMWINSRAQNDDATPTGVSVTPKAKSPGKATISVSGEEPADINVGETLNRATREKQSGLGGGSVTVRSGR